MKINTKNHWHPAELIAGHDCRMNLGVAALQSDIRIQAGERCLHSAARRGLRALLPFCELDAAWSFWDKAFEEAERLAIRSEEISARGVRKSFWFNSFNLV